MGWILLGGVLWGYSSHHTLDNIQTASVRHSLFFAFIVGSIELGDLEDF